jgi:hypothetical protein
MSERELRPRADSAAPTKKLSKRTAGKQAAEQPAYEDDDQPSAQTPTPSKTPKKLAQFFAGESGKTKSPDSSKIKLGALTFDGPEPLPNEPHRPDNRQRTDPDDENDVQTGDEVQTSDEAEEVLDNKEPVKSSMERPAGDPSSSDESDHRPRVKRSKHRRHRRHYESDSDYDIPLKYQEVKISPLKSPDDYITWEPSMEIVLMREGTLKLVQGKLEEPNEGGKVHYKWEVLNDRAIATIRVNCGKELQRRIRRFTDARKIWLYIEKHDGKSTSAKGIESFMKLTRMRLDEHSSMRSYFAAAYDHIEEINRRTGNQPFQDWMACLLLVKGLPSKYDIWTSRFMEKIEDSAHYHNVLKFEELEAALTAEEARMNPDPVVEEANIV